MRHETKDAATPLQGWEHLHKVATDVSAIDRGARMVVPATLANQVEQLVAIERSCCSFLDISTELQGESVTVEVTTENPDGLPIISLLAGIPLP